MLARICGVTLTGKALFARQHGRGFVPYLGDAGGGGAAGGIGGDGGGDNG
jgi:hypothetical protein